MNSFNNTQSDYPYDQSVLGEKSVRLVLDKCNFKIPKAAFAECRAADVKIEALKAQKDRFEVARVFPEFERQLAAETAKLVSGESLDIDSFSQEQIAAEFATKRAALCNALAKIIGDARPHLLEITRAALAAADALASKLEAQDRANCEEFGLPFYPHEASPAARFVRSNAQFLAQIQPQTEYAPSREGYPSSADYLFAIISVYRT